MDWEEIKYALGCLGFVIIMWLIVLVSVAMPKLFEWINSLEF